MEELIRIRDLSTEDNNTAALKDFRLQVFSSEIIGLIGLNGSGKSTLAEVLSGELSIKNGQIFFHGIIYKFINQKISRILLQRQGIFVIKNENRLIENLNISENMSISLKRRMIDLFKNPGKKEKLVELTIKEFFPGLNPSVDVADLPPSVHWQIGILKAYLEGARLIVLDRIIEFCNEIELQELFRFIRVLTAKSVGFIITYNKIAPILKSFDRIGIVRNGILTAVIHKDDYNPKLAANLIIGREYNERKPERENLSSAGRSLLEIREQGISQPPDRVNLILYTSEILGIYDPVQDKTTALIELLSGSIPAGSRQILVENKIVKISEEYHAVRAGIGIVSEKIFDNLFFKDLTAGQNLAVSAAKRSSGFGGYIAASAEDFLENSYLKDTGFPESEVSVPVEYVEKDLQFILALHMRILSGAKILILENPVRGADLLTRKMMYHKIELLRKSGTGIIFISTDYSELDGFCDRIIQYDEIGSL